MVSPVNFKPYIETLALLDEAQLVFEVGKRLKAFNEAEQSVIDKVKNLEQPTIADWMVIDEARTKHRLAQRELDKRQERRETK